MPNTAPVNVKWISVDEKLPELYFCPICKSDQSLTSNGVLVRLHNGEVRIAQHFAHGDEDRDEHGIFWSANNCRLAGVTHWGRPVSGEAFPAALQKEIAHEPSASSSAR